MRESELPGTESIQVEAGGPLAVGRGGQKWICKFDSKEFGFYSVFSRKPQKTFKEKVMCLKKILLEY